MKNYAFAVFVVTLAAAGWVLAQTTQEPVESQTQRSGFSPAKSVGLYVYPKKKQNADRQLKDENACYGSAKNGTGIDPQAMSSEPGPERVSRGRPVARGAAGGAAVGAIAGDAGKGAAIGAGAGAVAHRRRAREDSRRENEHGVSQSQRMEEFKRDFTACMDAKGYSVR